MASTPSKSSKSITETHSASLGIVIPTYNEITNIKNLLEQLLKLFPKAKILIVDDNSPDRTWEVVEQYSKNYPNVLLAKRSEKDGLGNAYKHGFQKILQHPVSQIVQLDADFSHPLQSIPDLVKGLKEADVVIGSRYANGVSVVNWELSRILLSSLGNRLASFVTRLPLSDMTSGFKCYRREALENVHLEKITANGFFFQVEMNVILHKLGFKLAEHPIIFTNRMEGFSKLSTFIIFEALFRVLLLPFRSYKKFKRHSS